MEKMRTINSLLDVINEFNKLSNVLMVLDIDGVTLSNKFGEIFVDPYITELISLSYNNLIFLTARDKSLKNYSKNQLNKAGLINTNFNDIICSPDDNNGNSTKGEALLKYSKLKNYDHIIFVDDSKQHAQDVFYTLTNKDIKNTVFYYHI
jgi:hypothetical protein